MDKKIFVWVKEPGKDPRHVWISNTLKNLQKTVGGYIENFQLAPDEAMICNEEGLILNLPYNCTVLGMPVFGTIIFAGTRDENYTDSNMDIKLVRGLMKEEI